MKKITVLIAIIVGSIYIYLQYRTIFGGDGGELVTASYTLGIAHPPGFPLYTFIGYLLSKIPLFNVSWRIALLSSIPAIISRVILFLILNNITKKWLFSFVGTIFYSFLYPVWLFSEIPEVVSLNVLFLTAIIYLTYQYWTSNKLTLLYLLTFVFGVALF
ncbi:MAG: DUF2723 domain-containing protein, partial [bacterium]|nr:DUF2723 domain-containing protein [bacterium]